MTHRTGSTQRLNEIPQPILAASAGLAAITVVIVGAIGLRSLFSDGHQGTGRHGGKGSLVTAPSPDVSADEAEPATKPDAERARELRARVEKDLRTKRFTDFVKDVEELLQVDQDAANDRKIKLGIIEALMIVMTGGEDTADKLFEVLEKRMGTAGIDVLYELVTTRGGSRAAERAGELLRDESVRARGTAALRIAYELRTAPCATKGKLFGRAKADGDKRAHDELLKLKTCRSSPRCCLYAKSAELQEAMDAIEARPR